MEEEKIEKAKEAIELSPYVNVTLANCLPKPQKMNQKHVGSLLTEHQKERDEEVENQLFEAMKNYTSATVWGLDGTQILLQNLLRETIENTLESQDQKLIERIRGMVEAEYHFWRECHNCGYAGGGYLHCLHDGVQTPCHNCDEKMPSLYGKGEDCECEFVIKVDDVLSKLG